MKTQRFWDGRSLLVVLVAVLLSVSCEGGGQSGENEGEERGDPTIRFAASDLVVHPLKTYAILEWTFPSDGASIRSIQVEVSRGGKLEVYSVGLGETSYRVDNLEEWVDYDFQVIFTYEDGSIGRLSKKMVRLKTDIEDAYPTVYFP